MMLLFNEQKRLRICWRLLMFLFLTFALNVPVQLLLQQILSESLLRGYISAVVFMSSLIASLYIQIRLIEKTSFSKYGLRIDTEWVREFLFGCSIATLQLLVFYVILYYLGYVTIHGYFSNASGGSYSFIEGFVAEIFGQLVGSMGEELFFRSFLFYLSLESLHRFRAKFSIKIMLATLITAFFFGLAHYSNENATLLSTINLTIDGIMLAIPFLLTGRLGMSIGIHFFWNVLVGAVFGAGVSGNLAKVSLLDISFSDNLVTGGAFGPEGSVLIIVLDALAVAIVFLWWKNKKNALSIRGSSTLDRAPVH